MWLQGAYGLHYCRALGAVRPIEALIDASSGDLIAPLHNCKPYTDADIEAAARRLGLIAPAVPGKMLKRKAPACLPPLDRDEGTDFPYAQVVYCFIYALQAVIGKAQVTNASEVCKACYDL